MENPKCNDLLYIFSESTQIGSHGFSKGRFSYTLPSDMYLQNPL